MQDPQFTSKLYIIYCCYNCVHEKTQLAHTIASVFKTQGSGCRFPIQIYQLALYWSRMISTQRWWCPLPIPGMSSSTIVTLVMMSRKGAINFKEPFWKVFESFTQQMYIQWGFRIYRSSICDASHKEERQLCPAFGSLLKFILVCAADHYMFQPQSWTNWHAVLMASFLNIIYPCFRTRSILPEPRCFYGR